GHLAPPFAQGPDVAERADALRPAELHRRLIRAHARLVLIGPIADEPPQPRVFLLQFHLPAQAPSFGYDTAEHWLRHRRELAGRGAGAVPSPPQGGSGRDARCVVVV